MILLYIYDVRAKGLFALVSFLLSLSRRCYCTADELAVYLESVCAVYLDENFCVPIRQPSTDSPLENRLRPVTYSLWDKAKTVPEEDAFTGAGRVDFSVKQRGDKD